MLHFAYAHPWGAAITGAALAALGLVGIVLWLAMWCVSDEPYEQVAPFKREQNLRAIHTHDALRERGGQSLVG